ncbi:PREDICTED: tachykinin-like peptides receptor 99D isoform X4 [Acropora digitifera]|nr:PREDICTED: tachykinin-like peptides receptor 99D isoform X4 [Acropora digitifera]
MDPVSEKAVIAVQSVIVVVALVGNSLVCAVILKNRGMRTTMNCLLLNLAIADITVVAFFASRFILIHAYNHPDGKVGTVLCKLLTGGTFGWIGSCASVFTLVAIAIERYYAVIRPLGNRATFTKYSLKIIIPVSWIFGIILCLPDFLVKDFCKSYRACVANWPPAHAWMPKAYILLWTILIAAIPVSVMTVLYSRVVFTLWLKPSQAIVHDPSEQGRSRVRKRVTTMVLVVSVIFAFCWITECTDYTLLVFFPKLALGNATHVISSTLIMFNSSINPIVYALISHRFRDEIIRMIRVTHRTRIRKRPEFKISCENKASSNQTAEDEPNRNMDNKENCARSRRNPTRSALFANCVAVENVTET